MHDYQYDHQTVQGFIVSSILADDSITIQKVISITFASEDYDLVVVGGGDAAIQKARELHPDLIMADVAMPGKNGYEVCSFVKNDSALRNTPVLLLAGTFEPLNRDEAMKAGADDSIVKPFESQELLGKVRELLSRSGGAGTASAPRVAAAPAAPEIQTSDMWEAGDFLTLPDEFDSTKDDKGLGADLDFLSSGALFEAGDQKDLSLRHTGTSSHANASASAGSQPSQCRPSALSSRSCMGYLRRARPTLPSRGRHPARWRRLSCQTLRVEFDDPVRMFAAVGEP